MSIPETVARWEERVRPFLTLLPPALAVHLYSQGRRRFLAALTERPPAPQPLPPLAPRRLWGLDFRLPLLNAAGMFKTGSGYELVAHQGAGGFLAGTSTGRPRKGNRRAGVFLPFAPYPRSGAASNWLGLPNLGHREVAARLAGIVRVAGCPVGASLAASPEPDLGSEERIEGLVAGLRLYDEAGVDFLEINESCPNTEGAASSDGELAARLRRVAEGFLATRRRSLPVIVKFSCDTSREQLPRLVDLLGELGFDGVNLGNTSTDYEALRERVDPAERSLYDHFTATFGGGVSGRPLKERSLSLAAAAVEHLARHGGAREFHVVRTGGIEGIEDLRASEDAGVALDQWYTGYFAAFARAGHGLYRELAECLGPQEAAPSHPRARTPRPDPTPIARNP